jgi:hypothetical protein
MSDGSGCDAGGHGCGGGTLSDGAGYSGDGSANDAFISIPDRKCVTINGAPVQEASHEFVITSIEDRTSRWIKAATTVR